MLDARNVVTRDEGHSMHATRREAVYQQCNQPWRQAMSRSIAVDWCLLCVWATKIYHFDSLHQYATHARGAVQDRE